MIMIGSMYCGEGDFDKCCEMVRDQNCQCDHKIIEGLPELQAHETLYHTFKDGGYSHLIKLDADIVLANKTVVSDMVSLLGRYKVERLSFLVSDYFTNDLMTGIHCYSSKVIWDWAKFVDGNLKPDRTDSSHRPGRARTVQKLGGWHCFHATEKQSFHFGYHRVKKGQGARILQIAKRYEATPENNLRLAILGGIAALENSRAYIGYADLDDVFEQYKGRAIDGISVRRLFK